MHSLLCLLVLIAAALMVLAIINQNPKHGGHNPVPTPSPPTPSPPSPPAPAPSPHHRKKCGMFCDSMGQCPDGCLCYQVPGVERPVCLSHDPEDRRCGGYCSDTGACPSGCQCYTLSGIPKPVCMPRV